MADPKYPLNQVQEKQPRPLGYGVSIKKEATSAVKAAEQKLEADK